MSDPPELRLGSSGDISVSRSTITTNGEERKLAQ
jgi:hypothetical protein